MYSCLDMENGTVVKRVAGCSADACWIVEKEITPSVLFLSSTW